MASGSGGRSSATSRISLHKINVYHFLCSRSLRGDVLPPPVCSAVFLPHTDTPTRTTTSKTASPCRWYMLKLSYRFTWKKCSRMYSKLSYYVSYNDPHRCKEATDLHKIFENIIHWLINYWICIALEAVRCNKLLVGWQFKYFHVRYIKITAHKISWGSIYNDGKNIHGIWMLRWSSLFRHEGENCNCSAAAAGYRPTSQGQRCAGEFSCKQTNVDFTFIVFHHS